MSSIAVLITCHNRKTKTLACLTALYHCVLPRGFYLDTFLVDDACTDGTREAVHQDFPQVKIIQGDGNLYWNRGMILAWKTAIAKQQYDYYLWLNDDTTLFKAALADLFSLALEYPKAIVCGATCSQVTGAVSYGGKMADGTLIVPNGQLQECNEINGNCVVVPAAVFDRIGMLDNVFTHAIGDFDYGLRAKKAGIVSYSSMGFIGYCEANKTLPKWCLPQTPIQDRFKILYSPVGYAHPYYQFVFERRHHGWLTAIWHLFTIHLRALIPQLWKYGK